MDPWPRSEAGRFHRGISLALTLIAAPILAVEALRDHAPLEPADLGATSFAVGLMAWHLRAAFRATPANFPLPNPAPPSRIPAESPRVGYTKDKEARG